MWKLIHKESRVLKNWCCLIVLLENTLENSLDCKEIKRVNPKGNQPWIFIGRIYADAEAPILWSPDVKSWLWKRPWCCERLKAGGERGKKDEMFGWYHWFSGHEFEQTLGDCDRQGSPACFSSWGRKEHWRTMIVLHLCRQPSQYVIYFIVEELQGFSDSWKVRALGWL